MRHLQEARSDQRKGNIVTQLTPLRAVDVDLLTATLRGVVVVMVMVMVTAA